MKDYQVIKKLGSGAFADVYMVKKDNHLYAMKKTKPSEDNNRDSIKEVSILEKFQKSDRIINLVSYKIHENENKLFIEYLGNELHYVVKNYQDNDENIPIKVVKRFVKQILEGLIELEQNNILHNDLKPENILFTKKLDKIFKTTYKKFRNKVYKKIISSQEKLKIPIRKYVRNKYKRANSLNKYITEHIKKQYSILREMLLLKTELKVSDFGNAVSKEILSAEPNAIYYTRATRYYRSPESLLKTPYWIKSDMWSLGCIIYELLTGDTLFDPLRDNNMSINSYHIAIMIKTFGDIPAYILDKGQKTCKYFILDDNGDYVYKFKYLIGKKEPLLNYLIKNGLCTKDAIECYEFLRSFFEYDPDKRISPYLASKHNWLDEKN